MCLPYMICSICIGYLNDETALSSYGLCTTFINIFYNALFLGIQEVLGSFSARGYASKNYLMMGKAFYQVRIILESRINAQFILLL